MNPFLKSINDIFMVEIILKSIKSLFGFGVQVKTISEEISIKTKDDISEEKVLSVEDIYTPLSVAKEEIWRRWNDKELRKKVEDFLGDDIPEFFLDFPHATIVRHIISPNYELFYCVDLFKQLGLDFRCCEFPEDKFIAKNRDKYN